jgi:AraC-like DNA-binding protein
MRLRHRPDGSVWVRTFPLTLVHDQVLPAHTHDWDQLTYAASGVLRVDTAAASWTAVWVPAGVAHAEHMFAPVAMRTLYFAPRLAGTLPRRECRAVNISNLLRELILHASRQGALDRRIRAHAHAIGMLLEQLAVVTTVPLQLPTPRDGRARRVASFLRDAPDARSSVAALARRAGASRRTIERLFVRDTGMSMAEWRRRLRLLHAVRLLAEGESVTSTALASGYASVSAFIAVFKREFGVTPRRYAASGGNRGDGGNGSKRS